MGRSGASRNSVYIWSTIYVYTREPKWHPQSNTLQPDQPQNDRPTACVSSHCAFTAARKNLACVSKMLLYYLLLFLFRFYKIQCLKLRNLTLRKLVSVCTTLLCGPNIFFSTSFSNTTRLFFPLMSDNKFHTHIKQLANLQFCIRLLIYKFLGTKWEDKG
jgi:hypothetical protein